MEEISNLFQSEIVLKFLDRNIGSRSNFCAIAIGKSDIYTQGT